MGSKGRIPPYVRQPLPGPGMFQPEPYGSGIHAPDGPLPFDLMPPPEIMEQKLVVQHMEMQTLVTENHKLAATHSALRHELAATQHELQRLQAYMAGGNVEHEQQMRAIMDKLAKMDADMKSSKSVKVEVQQARAEAQSLVAAREELISKVQQLTQELHKSHGDAQQIPSMISELETLRKEYQHCRAAYDYERKLRVDHYESLQVMEKNYVSMVGEVEKLRRELSNSANLEKMGSQYGSNIGYKEGSSSEQHPMGQNVFEDGYKATQVVGPSAPNRAASAALPAGPGYDAARGTAYDPARTAAYNASRGSHYDALRAPSYEPPRGFNYDSSITGRVYEANTAGGGAHGAVNAGPPYPTAQPLPASYYGHAYGAVPHLHQAAYGGASQASSRPVAGYEAMAARVAPGGAGGSSGSANQGQR
ncbi:hypothetical protein AXF42_Ash015689 [Apostasia shenzhenica]|uniref:Protein FLX-like 2 n=1 Tax=Apostasia shenzhenica TaxID=1088818 RepID=A0A2H9ZU26_9ASPA|nr:hypothetical protein AXF42_Ash015689 [Apostasia shenzhenica]